MYKNKINNYKKLKIENIRKNFKNFDIFEKVSPFE